MEQPELMSFMEWRELHPVKKKKEKKDESRSLKANGEIGITNGEGQGAGHHQEISFQGVHVFPSPEF
jgi:hypothetical protein